jgi:hypothetical protein
MTKLMLLGLMAALIIGSAWLLGCGGGEKQAGDEPGTQEMMAEAGPEGQGEIAGGDVWEDIPIYSGAERFENEMTQRMSAAMSAGGEGGSSKVRFFKSGDDFDKIVSYYKSHMPRKGWKKITDQEEEEGWGCMWQKGDQVMANVSVIRDIDGERGIIIARHEGIEKP